MTSKVPENAIVQTPAGLVVGATVTPTQIRRPWRSTARTVFQAFVMLCFIAPAIYSAAAQHDPQLATGWAAGGLAIAGAVTRVMAVPGVERFLRRFLPFLAAAPKSPGA